MGARIKNGQQPKPQGRLKALYWHQIFGMDSAVVPTQNNLAHMEVFQLMRYIITKNETIILINYATT